MVMTYDLNYFDAQGMTGTDHSFGFTLAKTMAVRAVESGCALRTEIRNAKGQLRFAYPRTLRRA